MLRFRVRAAIIRLRAPAADALVPAEAERQQFRVHRRRRGTGTLRVLRARASHVKLHRGVRLRPKRALHDEGVATVSRTIPFRSHVALPVQ